MAQKRSSQWPVLFDLSIDILRHFETANGFMPAWSFGGGTALMLQIDHRESHDIDIFLGDPQYLPLLNPETQDIALTRQPDNYETDGSRALKLAYAQVGEIDFICCEHILQQPTESREIRGQQVEIETPAEIIAKKIYFRGGAFQPRDMFDLAAVAEHFGEAYVRAALEQCGRERCETALAMVQKANPDFVKSVIGQLMLRESTAHLIDEAQHVTEDLLRRTLA